MQMMRKGTNSYRNWAYIISSITGQYVTKQAISLRMTNAWLTTVKSLVETTIKKQISKQVNPHLFKQFKNVWLQDSTCLQLPETLYEKYRCNVQNGKKSTVAKLNIVMNVLNGFCPVMSWEGFNVSEPLLGKRITEVAHKGDLIIRDLGYFGLSSFRDLQASGVSFLSKLRYGVVVYNLQGRRIDLTELMKDKEWLDTVVLLGEQKELQTRMVVVRLPEQVIATRKRNARKHKSSTTRHSKDYYDQLDYIVFITNVSNDVWSYKEVCDAYRVRWNIEILFKSWKSGLHIDKIIPADKVKTERVESFLYLILLYLTWFNILLYEPLKLALFKKSKYLSILKLAQWITLNYPLFANVRIKQILPHAERYCCYETRGDRLNNLAKLFALT